MTKDENDECRETLTEAHNNFAKGLNRHAFFKVHSHDTGQDLVQDTFTKTWRYLAKGGKIKMMKAFLYHVLNNLIIDQYRKDQRKTTSLDAMIEEGFEPGIEDFEKVFDAIDGQTMMLLIDKLKPVYKKIMHMGYTKQMSNKEISEVTGQTTNAVSVQLHRGLARLRELYNK